VFAQLCLALCAQLQLLFLAIFELQYDAENILEASFSVLISAVGLQPCSLACKLATGILRCVCKMQAFRSKLQSLLPLPRTMGFCLA
jgi:hypothetical protein